MAFSTTARGLATEVPRGSVDGVRDRSVASLDNVQLVPVGVLLRRAGRVAPERGPESCTAMAKVMAC